MAAAKEVTLPSQLLPVPRLSLFYNDHHPEHTHTQTYIYLYCYLLVLSYIHTFVSTHILTCQLLLPKPLTTDTPVHLFRFTSVTKLDKR